MLDLLEPFRSTSAWWIIAVGMVTNVSCALLGCYLVLRRMSLMGDALAHSVLPGLIVAFLFAGSLNIVPMYLGAIGVGLLATFLIQSLHQYGRVPADASMGVVFTSLFALGVVLLKRYLPNMHFDAACVYEGSLQFVALDLVTVAGIDLPRTFVTSIPVLLVNLLVVGMLWKEFKISSFDPALSSSMGFSAPAMHYLLMTLVAVTTVSAFEAVGSILVVAMLIVPAAMAHLLCDRLGRMMILASLIAMATSVGGYWLAYTWNVNPAGAMAVFGGALYGLAVLLSPKYGILSTLSRNLQTSLRIVREDILSMLYRMEELGSPEMLQPTNVREAVGGGLLARWGLLSLVRSGNVNQRREGLLLTDTGRDTARQLVRSHRLWEAYLVQHLGLPLDHVHEPAHRIEHFLDEKMQRDLTEAIDDTATDPHGREIPE